MMISLNVTFYADEVILRLDQLPKKIHSALIQKIEEIFQKLEDDVLNTTRGKYLSVTQMQSGTSQIGSSTIGYLEYNERDDKYPIVPKSALLLHFRAKDGGWVRTDLVMHPYPKGKIPIEQTILQAKPWILEQLNDAARVGLQK